jgi:pyridoxal phosphate enzyme (YggS family)
MMSFSENLQQVENKIAEATRRSGRERSDVTLVAVTKTWAAQKVREAYQAGLRSFGENYVQEALEKTDALKDLPGMDWHFIGHLQSNKVKSIVGRFSLIHSVDRFKIANEIDARTRADAEAQPQGVLLEVNIGEEVSKEGVSLGDLPKLLDEVQELSSVVVRGLMIMPPPNWSKKELQRGFALIRDERDRLRTRVSAPHGLIELSMGTSQDYVEAIEAGATIVRLGTVLFGQRG